MSLLFGVVIIIIIAGAWQWYQQSQRVAALEGQMEEADYWARQSKLALARFQGDLSETGESLAERGSTIEQRLGSQEKKLASTDGEIKKLWALANEKNRTELIAQGKQLDTLGAKVDSQADALAGLGEQQTAGQARVTDLAEQMAGIEPRIGKLDELTQSIRQDLTKVTSSLDAVDERVAQRLQRFEREQSLAAGGLEGRVTALEDRSANVRKIESRLATVEQTLKSIDSARAQLTSRLVRLSDQVDSLRKP